LVQRGLTSVFGMGTGVALSTDYQHIIIYEGKKNFFYELSGELK